MFGLFGLGAAKPKPIAPPKPAKPDPKVQQAQNKINADIKQITNFMASTPLTPEWTAYLQCLQRRLNDISIICNEPTTPLAKVRQMYNEAQAQAKKDVKAAATVAKKEEKAAVVQQKKETAALAKAARKAKKLANGQTIQIEPQEEAKVNALQNEIANTSKQIADVKAKIAAAKAARAKGKQLRGLSGLGDVIGGVQIDCTKKKNLTICAIAQLTQQTQDQMSGLIQILMDKQSELEALLAELSALVATTPTAADISAEIVANLPTPATADEIGEAVGTRVTDAIITALPPSQPGYYSDPYSQPGYYSQPPSGSYPSGTVIVDPYTGQPINTGGGYQQPQQPQVISDAFDFGAEGSQQEIFPTASQPASQTYLPSGSSTVQFIDAGGGADAAAQPLPNMDDLLNDFGDEYYAREADSGFLMGLGCGGKQGCGCKG